MLVGREVECARIDALVMGLRDGRGRTLVLRGEPGIGKTALLAYAAEESELRGVRVVRARGVEAEADLRFAGVVELLRPLVPLLEALPAPQAEALRGVLGIVPRLDGKLLIGVAMLSLLSVAAEECPLVGLVDDAHWLDEGSAEVLLFAARRLQDDPVALLFAARIGEPRRFDAPGVEELVLAGLGGEEARELLAGAGHDSHRPWRTRCRLRMRGTRSRCSSCRTRWASDSGRVWSRSPGAAARDGSRAAGVCAAHRAACAGDAARAAGGGGRAVGA